MKILAWESVLFDYPEVEAHIPEAFILQILDGLIYRSLYNARQILARFALTPRDEVGLEPISAALAAVVNESLKPETFDL